MKNTNEIVTTIYRQSDLEEYLKRRAVENKKLASELALDHATFNRPLEDESEKPYIGSLTQACNQDIAYAKTSLQVENHTADLEMEERQLEVNIEAVKDKMTEAKNDRRIKKRELEKLEERGHLHLVKKEKAWKMPWLPVSIFFVFIDSIMNASAWIALGMNFIFSTSIGFGVGLGCLIIAINAKDIISKGQTTIARKTRMLGIVAGLFVVFSAIGFLRASNLEQGIEGWGRSPYIYALINIFFFCVTVAISYYYKMSKDERRKLNIYKGLKEELKSLSDQVAGCQKEIVQLEKDHSDKQEARVRIKEYAKDIEKLINAYYLESYQEYCAQNIFKRSDNKTPKFFHSPPPGLSFNFYSPNQ